MIITNILKLAYELVIIYLDVFLHDLHFSNISFFLIKYQNESFPHLGFA